MSRLVFRPEVWQGALFSFYDGDPNRNGRAFGNRTFYPTSPKGSQPLIRTTYRANQCGVHQLFAVLNQGEADRDCSTGGTYSGFLAALTDNGVLEDLPST